MLFKNISLYRDGAIHRNQYVRVTGKTITYIGSEPPQHIKGEEERDGADRIMLPGFVNMHSHIPMTLLRGYGEGLPLNRWLTEKMFPFEDRMGAEDMYWGTSLGLLEMIASGTVSYSDMYYFIDDIARATVEAGVKANIARGVVKNPQYPTWQEHSARKDIEGLERLVRDHGWDDLIRVETSIHGEYTTDERLVREMAEFARERSMPVHVHVSETRAEHEACIQRHGKTPVAYFADLGLFDGLALAAHCVHVSDEDIDILKAHDVTVAHCISSNLKLGSGFAPVKKFMDKGVRVTLGTDGAASNNNLDFMQEIHLAAMVHKGLNQDSMVLSPQDMLTMATRNGAVAQGRPLSGELTEGSDADLILISTAEPHMTPSYDPLSNIIYAATAQDVCLTMVNGKVLYENGEYRTLDREKILYHARQAQRRIVSELEGGTGHEAP